MTQSTDPGGGSYVPQLLSAAGPELADRVHRLARALARHGIDDERRLALVSPDAAAAVPIRYAAALLGAASFLPSPGMPAGALTGAVAAAGADVVVVWPATVANGAGTMRAMGTRLVLGIGLVAGADVDLDATAADELPAPVADRSRPDAPAVLGVDATGAVVGFEFGEWLDLVTGTVEPADDAPEESRRALALDRAVLHRKA